MSRCCGRCSHGRARPNMAMRPARDVARLRSANPDGIPAWTEEDAARFSAEGEAARVTHPTSAPFDLLRSAPRVG